MNIYLFCNAGMSTSMVASMAQQSFATKGRTDIVLEAFDMSMLPDVIDEADMVVLGPQIAWQLEKIQKEYPEKKVVLLTMQEFGSMNGDVISARLEKEM